MTDHLKISPISESACIVYFGEAIDIALPPLIGQYANAVCLHFGNAILDCTPSYTSLVIEYHPLLCSYHDVVNFIGQYQPNQEQTQTQQPLVTIPAFYHPKVAPDLAPMAAQLKLAIDEVVRLHCEAIYTVCAIGFAPGFAFMAQVNPKIEMPRLKVPRKKVPKGSIGIANQQTAIYPSETPGGWQIIGNSPIALFDVSAPQDSLLSVGQRVQFQPITEAEYIDLGGKLCHW
ncbi:5-oxoprolinase subunit B family protein [Vibrio hippocampi]|uniref:5-oxoprolinase subunit B n=1 Tax=Vibrio hippocampi TaxID=654686 RepID=A0ABN8DHN9_9VIBR|nr:allophanate hydrolase subunit 1 [Vibrio hippocampi]CAH0525121.1 5-oxoprolinase subunit B [Vibrio hippocampi]